MQYRVEQASILVISVELAADCESRALNRQLRYLASRRAANQPKVSYDQDQGQLP